MKGKMKVEIEKAEKKIFKLKEKIEKAEEKIAKLKEKIKGEEIETENICRLKDPMLIVAPQDKGEPPSWVPAWHGEKVVWVDRKIFDKLKRLRDEKPCEICPAEIKEDCKHEEKKA